MEQAHGIEIAELHPELPPVEIFYIWSWFLELHAGRPSNGLARCSLPYSEILAWATLTGSYLTPWEVSVIKQLDNAWLETTE